MSRLSAPSPGTFLRPVGNYGYTMEVLAVYPPFRRSRRAGLPRISYRRWGLKDGLPFDDGHLSVNNGCALRYRAPGVFSEPAWYPDRPRYGFVLYQVVPGPNGQMGLFA